MILATNLQVNVRRSGHYFELTPRRLFRLELFYGTGTRDRRGALSRSLHTNCFSRFLPRFAKRPFRIRRIHEPPTKLKKAFKFFFVRFFSFQKNIFGALTIARNCNSSNRPVIDRRLSGKLLISVSFLQ